MSVEETVNVFSILSVDGFVLDWFEITKLIDSWPEIKGCLHYNSINVIAQLRANKY